MGFGCRRQEIQSRRRENDDWKKALHEFRRRPGDGVVLFLVNMVAVQREHAAKAAAAGSLAMAEATDSVRFQMMQNASSWEITC